VNSNIEYLTRCKRVEGKDEGCDQGSEGEEVEIAVKSRIEVEGII
jgi:hypothetical protein